MTGRERARESAGRGEWGLAYELLSDLADRPDADPDDLDTLADAAWWLCKMEESIEHRQRAHAGHMAAGARRRAAYSAWMVFYEHSLAGRSAIAAGWLARARRHLAGETESVEHAYITLAEVFDALGRGTPMRPDGMRSRWRGSPSARAAPTSRRWRWSCGGLRWSPGASATTGSR